MATAAKKDLSPAEFLGDFYKRKESSLSAKDREGIRVSIDELEAAETIREDVAYEIECSERDVKEAESERDEIAKELEIFEECFEVLKECRNVVAGINPTLAARIDYLISQVEDH
jgi:hypothetical protein